MVAQFLKELIDTRDFYVRDATCLLSRVEICDIIKFQLLSYNKIVGLYINECSNTV